MAITHNKVSTIADAGSADLVQASDWNEDHVFTDIVPETDSTSDLGSAVKQFAEAHIDTAYIDLVTTDTIAEATGAAGVTIDGVLLKDSTVKTDTIIEKTGAAGVTADGVLLKDDDVTAAQVFTDDIQQKTAAAGIKLSHNPYPGTDSAIDFGKSGATWQHVWAEGIAFPATQVASAGANVLDDFEEGTFTPTATLATVGDLSVAYGAQVGRYQKVGNRVHCFLRVYVTTWTFTTGSGAVNIGGLPFAAGGSGGTGYGAGSMIASYLDADSWAVMPSPVTSQTHFQLTIGTANSLGVAGAGYFATAEPWDLIGHFTYETA